MQTCAGTDDVEETGQRAQETVTRWSTCRRKKAKREDIKIVTTHASTAGNLEETKGRRRQ